VNRIQGTLPNALLIVLAFFMILPLLMSATNSFMSDGELGENYDSRDAEQQTEEVKKGFNSMKLIPDSFTLKQYYQVLIAKHKFLRMFWNSVFIVLPIVAGHHIIHGGLCLCKAQVQRTGYLVFHLHSPYAYALSGDTGSELPDPGPPGLDRQLSVPGFSGGIQRFWSISAEAVHDVYTQ